MHQAEIIVLLFALVAVLAVLACKVALPYPIVLVIGGLALSFVPRLPEVKLNPDTVFYFILPALLYPAALFTSWRDFRRNLRPILLLAIGLVLVTTVTVAWIAHTILPMLPWAAAFALGAIVSPPDAIAATAILRRLGVPYRLQAFAFWEMVVFLLNGFVFIVIGLQLPGLLRALNRESLAGPLITAIVISITVILVRFAWVLPATYLPRLLSRKLRARYQIPPWQDVAVVGWAGMRGVVSLAAAFALTLALSNGSPFPGRDYILFFAFSVILATLVLQGLTLPYLIRKLGITHDGEADEEERRARLEANKAAIELIEELRANGKVSPDTVGRLRAEYDERVEQLQLCAENPDDCRGEIATPQYQRLQRKALRAERQTIIRLRNERVINDDALRRIQRDLDLAEARLTGG